MASGSWAGWALGAALVGLSMLGLVPWWATLLMMGREVAITLLRFAVLRHGIIPALAELLG